MLGDVAKIILYRSMAALARRRLFFLDDILGLFLHCEKKPHSICPSGFTGLQCVAQSPVQLYLHGSGSQNLIVLQTQKPNTL